MTPSNEEALFALALAKPAEKRAPLLDAVCDGDPLEALLAAHEQPKTLVGMTLGRYKLREKLGEGGCGTVYVAEQTEPVRRKVALKVIKLGMDTREVIARFEAERQALAMMDHPNIAKVLDAGTTEVGRPYFVMELVRGIKITDYCDQANCATRERLDLFIKICQAIQHAHQKGIIHRDIKPSNILVTLHDGVPVPKLIDFGIAKATEGRLTDATVYTQLNQFIGTPAYMSPEQAEMSGLDIDTRSDIYSLGVLLYELLAGSTPFDPKELMASGIDAMRKTIREKEPQRPSTRLATLGADQLTTTAKRRSADTSKLLHQLKGDLDWIVMKCLEKDRARRYDTANGLAADLNRHLNNEPVTARPPSAAYKFQKAFRRNKLAFAAAAAVAVALLFGVVVSTWQAVRASHAEKAEKRQRSRAEQAAQLAAQEATRANRESTAAGSARQLAESRLVRLNVAEGWHRVADGDLFGALTSFTEALKLEEQDPQLAAAHRLRLASVLRQSPKLVQIWSVGGKLTHAEPSRDAARILTATTLSTNQAVAQIWDAATGRPLTPLMEHTNAISSIEWSADGSRVVTASADQTARVWDAATGRPLSAPLRHEAAVLEARFNTNASRVLTVSGDASRSGPEAQRQVTLWDVASGQSLWSVPGGYTFDLSKVSFSPDERLVIAGTPILDAKTSQVSSRLTDCLMAHQLEFSRDGKRALLTGHFTGTNAESARILDGQDLSRVLAVTPSPNHPLFGRVSPDGARIATFTDYSSLRLWDTRTGEAVTAPLSHSGKINSISFSPDGRRVATAPSDQTARVWDTANGTAVTLPHGSPVRMAAFGADGHRLFTACEDGTVAVWDLRTALPRFTWALSRFSGPAIAVSPDGRLAAVPDGLDPTVRVWNLSNGELALPPPFTQDLVVEVTFSADGTKLLTIGSSAKVWDVATGKLLASPLASGPLLMAQDGLHRLPAFSRDGQRVVIGSRNTNELRVLDAATGDLMTRLNADSIVGRPEFSADGKQVVAAATNGTVFVWNLPASQPALRFPAGDAVKFATFSADGRRIATAGGKQARVWDARSGQPLTPPLRLEDNAHDVEFNPDGRWVVTAGQVAVSVRNATNGQPFAALLHRSAMTAASFSEDGKLLATAFAGRTVRVWDVATREPVTPPLPHAGAVSAAKFTPDGRWLLTMTSMGEPILCAWEMPKDNRSLADWTELAQAFAGNPEPFAVPPAGGSESAGPRHSESSPIAPVAAGAPNGSRTNSLSFLETWLALRQKHPLDFTISDSDLDAWERHAVARAEARNDWPAVVQQLTRLLQSHPDSSELLPRRASAYVRWAGAAGTSAHPERLQSALADYTRAIASVELYRDMARQSRKPLLMERAKILRQLDRAQEAQADILEAKDIPPRPADAGSHLIDLTPWYNTGFKDGLLTFTGTAGDFSALAPAGSRKRATGVEFDVRGIIMLGSQTSSLFGERAESVTGIKVARPCRRLHFLHAAYAMREAAGTAVAKLVLRLANGQTQTLDLKLGDDLWNYTFESGQAKPTKNSRLAWTDSANPRLPDGHQAQLVQTTWENPSPDIAVESIDYVSAMNDPAPILIAITTEP